MERLTDTTANKCCYDTWDLCGFDSVCKRDCWKPTPCKIPKIVDRLTQYEDTGFSPSDIADLRNELCLKCGKYKKAHKGACDGCRWKENENEV